VLIFAGCFGALWWAASGAGPINPRNGQRRGWRTAIEENIGPPATHRRGGWHANSSGRGRISHSAVRIRDIIVRDRDHAIVASAPKAEVRLSGAALLIGRLRAESLQSGGCEAFAVRITPDGNVTGLPPATNAKPLATALPRKKQAGLAPTFPASRRRSPPPGAAGRLPRSPQAQSAPRHALLPNKRAKSGLLAGLDLARQFEF